MCLTNDFGLYDTDFVLLEVGPLPNRQRGILVLMVLHYRIRNDGEHQKHEQDVQFILQAYEGAVGEGDNETE